MRNEIKPGEILELLKKRISGFDYQAEELEVGRVIQAGDGIALAWGLNNAMAGELVELELPGGKRSTGMIMNLEEETAGIILFSDYEETKEGCVVRRTGRVAEVPVGDALLGRVVDSLGAPVDGKGEINSDEHRRVEVKGPGIIERENVREPLQTGIKAIDAMIPIGRGQRELIIGDRRTGKTAIAVDTIINQQFASEGEPVYCFYVAIGQKRSSVVQLIENLRKHGALRYTTVIAATASDPAALQYLAPYAACAMAEHFRDSGRHALIVFDDLTKHAQAYRELSLLMRRSPGREAYPGDIFYLHSRLLERAAKLSRELGGGSLTALPIVETQEGDISAYIPTNVISITDGQIFLEAGLFNSGLRPAVNVGVSVSRVGGDAQVKAMKQTAGSLRINLAQFRELAAFMQFSSDLDAATKKQLDRGERLTEILKQDQYAPLDVYKQVLILRAGLSGRLDKFPTAKLRRYESELFEFLDAQGSEFMGRLRTAAAFTNDLETEFGHLLDSFESQFRPDAAGGRVDDGYTVNMAMAMNARHHGYSREMLQLVERVTARELAAPSLEKELEKIISGEDKREHDRFEDLVRNCHVIDWDESTDMTATFEHASSFLAQNSLDMSAGEILQALLAREAGSSTALNDFFAIPHFVCQGEEKFSLLLMRSRKGVEFSAATPAIHAIFFMVGSLDQRHFHLVALSAIARIVQSQDFENDWLQAGDTEALKKVVIDRYHDRQR